MSLQLSSHVLDWIIKQSKPDGKNQDVLELLDSWAENQRQPTFSQIENASNKLRIPFGYFFLDTPPIEDIPLLEYRTVDSIELEHPSRELIDTIHDMEYIQEWMKEELLLEESNRLSFVGQLRSSQDLFQSAKKTRTILGISTDWFKEMRSASDSFNLLRNKMSDLGVIVMINGIVQNNTSRPLAVDEFRAFTIVDEIAPLIFINNRDSQNGKVFSLLHEFIHILLGENSLYNQPLSKHSSPNPNEFFCNGVTAELLVPSSMFSGKWLETNMSEKDKIKNLSSFFHCSEVVIARRALDNDLISQHLYDEISENASYAFKNTKGKKGGNYYRTALKRFDRRFLNQVFLSLQAGRTTYTEAFRLTNTNRKTFDGLIEKAKDGLF